MAREGEGMIAEQEEEILDGKVESEPEESSPSKTDDQDTPGEGEKAQDGDGSSEAAKPDDMEGIKEGQSIPYERFKKVIEERNRLRNEHGSVQSELEEAQGYLKSPDVFRAILLSKGVTDKKVQDEKLREAGFEIKESKQEGSDYKSITEGLDLNTQEGWFKAMERAVKTFGKELVEPIQKKLSEQDYGKWEAQQIESAQATAKKYGIEFGAVGKDERNPDTAVGMMMTYLRQNPEDAKLGHNKILKLALAEKGYEIGKDKGLQEAKERNEHLKRSAVEDDAGETREGEPDSNWSVSDLMEWHRKHVK